MVLTQDIVKEFFDYDPEIGDLIWRKRDRRWFKTVGSFKIWNKRFLGTVARYFHKSSGYVCVKVIGRKYEAHRLIFLREYGHFPIEVDHINHIRTDNRLGNLREVTNRINGMNRSLNKKNLSGFTGVSWNSRSSRWYALPQLNGIHHYLGAFIDINEAAKTVQDFYSTNGFHPNHGKKVSDIS